MDKLIEKINLGENNDDWGYIDALENRVLADANIIKAAEELAEAARGHCDDPGSGALNEALAAYRAAVSERDE